MGPMGPIGFPLEWEYRIPIGMGVTRLVLWKLEWERERLDGNGRE